MRFLASGLPFLKMMFWFDLGQLGHETHLLPWYAHKHNPLSQAFQEFS